MIQAIFLCFGVYCFKEIVQGAITSLSIFKYTEGVKFLVFVALLIVETPGFFSRLNVLWSNFTMEMKTWNTSHQISGS